MTLFEGLPSSLRIGPFDVRVEVYVGKKTQDYANYFYADKLIRINSRKHTCAIAAVDTVLHELNHAIFDVYRLLKRDKEERVVGTLATGWTQVYRDNPQLIEWIKTACQ